MDAPYFIYPAVKALRSGGLEPEEETRLRRRIAANMGHRPSLRLLLGLDPGDFSSFYPDMAPPELSTMSTIDTFLSNYSPKSERPARGIGEWPGLESEHAGSAGPTRATGGLKGRKDADERPKTMAEAQILIKNRDYRAALEIIQALSLANPQKSIYFADQIRFLKKLIFNESKKQH